MLHSVGLSSFYTDEYRRNLTLFDRAVELAHAAGDAALELDILTTWADYSDWRLPPGATARIDEILAERGMLPRFYDVRLHELATQAVAMDGSGDAIVDELMAIRRYMIDAGDLRGEALARFGVAVVLFNGHHYGTALAELIACSELNRVLRSPAFEGHVRRYLRAAWDPEAGAPVALLGGALEEPDELAQARADLQPSFWGTDVLDALPSRPEPIEAAPLVFGI
jgi:hypothetical protein